MKGRQLLDDTGVFTSAESLDRASGQEEGARLEVTGAKQWGYMAPVVIDGVCNDMRMAREQIFVAVLSVISFEDAEEAVAIANDTPPAPAPAWSGATRSLCVGP